MSKTNEGTTSSSSFEYNKSATNTYKAPKLSKSGNRVADDNPDPFDEELDEAAIPSHPDELKAMVDKFDKAQIEKGMEVEKEHDDGGPLDVVKSPLDILKIALAHLQEDPQYYTKLEAVEEAFKTMPSTGVQKIANQPRVLSKMAKIMTSNKLGADEIYDQLIKVARKAGLTSKEAEEFVSTMDEGYNSAVVAHEKHRDEELRNAPDLPVPDDLEDEVDFEDPDREGAMEKRPRREGVSPEFFMGEATPKGFVIGQKVKAKSMRNVDLWIDEVPKGKDYVYVVDKKGHDMKMSTKDLTVAETKTFEPVLDSLNEITLGKSDKATIENFTDGMPSKGNKLTSDGKKLDGNWMGGNEIAYWKNGKIYFNDLGSKAAQTVQNAIRKSAPKNHLAEGTAAGGKEYVIRYNSPQGMQTSPTPMTKQEANDVMRSARKSGWDKMWVVKIVDLKPSERKNIGEDTTHNMIDAPVEFDDEEMDKKARTAQADSQHEAIDTDKNYADDEEGRKQRLLDKDKERIQRKQEKLTQDREKKRETPKANETIAHAQDPVWGMVEGCDNPSIKDEDKIIDPEDAEVELDEARFKFKNGTAVKYSSKSWKVKASTKDWVELEDKRGYTTIVDFDDITAFEKGSIITERDLALLNKEMDRMNRLVEDE